MGGMYINPAFFEKYIELLQRLRDDRFAIRLGGYDSSTGDRIADDLCDLVGLIRFLEYRMGEDCL